MDQEFQDTLGECEDTASTSSGTSISSLSISSHESDNETKHSMNDFIRDFKKTTRETKRALRALEKRIDDFGRQHTPRAHEVATSSTSELKSITTASPELNTMPKFSPEVISTPKPNAEHISMPSASPEVNSIPKPSPKRNTTQKPSQALISTPSASPKVNSPTKPSYKRIQTRKPSQAHISTPLASPKGNTTPKPNSKDISSPSASPEVKPSRPGTPRPATANSPQRSTAQTPQKPYVTKTTSADEVATTTMKLDAPSPSRRVKPTPPRQSKGQPAGTPVVDKADSSEMAPLSNPSEALNVLTSTPSPEVKPSRPGTPRPATANSPQRSAAQTPQKPYVTKTTSADEVATTTMKLDAPSPSRRVKPTPPRQSKGQPAGTPVVDKADSSEMAPLSNPSEALNDFYNKMRSPDWEVVIEAINILLQICKFHQTEAKTDLAKIVNALVHDGVKNLRTQIVRKACQACEVLIEGFHRSLDQHLELIGEALLDKTADMNKFLRADANKALDVLVVNTSTKRMANIALRGSGHKNVLVRNATARLLLSLSKKVGPQVLLTTPNEVRDHLLQCGATLLIDASLEARNYAKEFFRPMVRLPLFMKSLQSAVHSSKLSKITKALHQL